MRIKRYSQLNKDELVQYANNLSKEFTFSDAVFTIVYNRDSSGEWKYLIGKCEFYNDAEDVEEIYAYHAFFRKKVKNFELKDFLDSLEGNGYKISENLPPLLKDEKNPLNWSQDIIPSHVSASGYPEKQYNAKLAKNTHFDDGFLLGYEKEFYPSSREYLMDFMRFPVYHGQSHGGNGEFSLLLPDHRGRIVFENGKLSIQGEIDEVSLVGEIAKKGKVKINSEDTLNVNEREFNKSEIWLLGKDNEVLDYRSNTDWRYRSMGDSSDHALADQVVAMAEEGENLEIEFKPYIEIKNSKAEEVERTVCAFSNAKGGNLLLGIDDDTTITGIDKGVLKDYEGPVSKAIDTYIKDIKRRLGERLRYGDCFSISSVKVGEKHVLWVLVERTKKPNFYLNTAQGYIRKSGTSAKMLSSDEREKPENSFDLFNTQ